MRKIQATILTLFLGVTAAKADLAQNRYALILEDPPVAEKYAPRDASQAQAAQSQRQLIAAKQQNLRRELASRKIGVTGAAQTLTNAVFVTAPQDRVAELASLPGVKAVLPVRRYYRDLNQAVQLVNAPAAWSSVGGMQNAGSGIKIAVLDTGIDQKHPAFQDPSLPVPAGYPKCSGSDCAFTNNKVIVARSYVRQLAAGSASDPASDSRPDDVSPRDRTGHGTAVASCAAGMSNTGSVTITGLAPKAYLGNYRIFGSPEVNDSTTDDIIISALEDAFNDGMDIASVSLGAPALTGPLDTGAACGNSSGVPCDLLAYAVETASSKGMIVVVAAGNSGGTGQAGGPTFSTISSPANAPSAIAVGATTNSHIFGGTLEVPGDDTPANLKKLLARYGDTGPPPNPVTAPLRDVTQYGNDGLGCSSLPAGSMNGAIALIQRGTCLFSDKVIVAETAGAVGVVFYMADSNAPFTPGGLTGTGIPAAMISNSDGLALKGFLATNPGRLVSLTSTPSEQSTSAYNLLASFSSQGPSVGDAALKPDLSAVGTDVYMATQRYDPLGDMYSESGYTVADGTSFATPIVSGAAALVKQKHPEFTVAQVKSALVNTTTREVTTDSAGNAAGIQSVGAGKLDAGAATLATVTAAPATLSFGAVGSGSLPAARQAVITNTGSAAENLTISIEASGGAALAANPAVLPLAPGASSTVTFTLSGGVPAAGSYSGMVTVQGSTGSVRIPYLYLVGTGSPYNIIPVSGRRFDGTVGEVIPQGLIAFRLIDSVGLPVAGVPVTFTASRGGIIAASSSRTDAYGMAAARPVLGSQAINYRFTGTAAGLSIDFNGYARLRPNISSNGIVDSARPVSGAAVAPGSYISIFGTNLAESTGSASTTVLPLAIDFVIVSFDVPSAGISVPGHLTYVSPSQVNVQVPWELEGQSSVQVKVSINYTNGNVYTLPLARSAPAFFDVGSGVAALDANYALVNAANPARSGKVVQLFANGLGPVTNAPASGDPAPSAPLARTKSTPSVTIGGQQAAVSFSGLAPGFAALYQVNATVPAGLAAGTYPVAITIDGRTSQTSNLAVQ